MFSLDKIVFRTALAAARSLVEHGYQPDEAATLTCTGSWSVHRDKVLAILRAEDAVNDVGRDNCVSDE